MPAAKLCSSGTLNATKSEDGNNSLDLFMNQAIEKDPLLPFSRTVDSPVQWIQLLHALDQPDLPGWPLLTPLKVQMQKCEKCSREFYSPINYRRHIRVHRRSLNVNKESNKNRDILAAFWDKLSLEQVKEVVSFNNVTLKDIPGSSVIRALASSLRKPGVWTLPQFYVKAGSTLLDIIQAKPSGRPISSQELFSILDEASERTFLCAGMPESVQKYVFDGETAKSSLELKNIVASTSFLFELELVKAWIADKDAEALRCQKLLVEEEEAAQRRQAVLLERKKQKKLRQKEQKLREQSPEQNGDLNINVDTIDRPSSAEASGPSSPDSGLDYNPESTHPQVKESDEDGEGQVDFSSENINRGDSQSTELGANNHRNLATHHWHAPNPQRSSRYGFHGSSNRLALKPENIHKLGPFKDRNLKGNKVWTRKHKIDNDEDSLKQPPSAPGETRPQIEENKCEVIIGSISVALSSSQPEESQNTCKTEHPILEKKNAKEKQNKVNTGAVPVVSKHWRPVSRGETKNISSVDKGNDDNQKHIREPWDKNVEQRCMPFSAAAAKEFLAQRWKEALAGDHVTLVLSSASDSTDIHHSPTMVSDDSGPNREEQSRGNFQVKGSKKTEKSLKVKYIPKQKPIA